MGGSVRRGTGFFGGARQKNQGPSDSSSRHKWLFRRLEVKTMRLGDVDAPHRIINKK